MRANETYLEAKRQLTVRNSDVLMNAQYPVKWSTLKSVVFCLSSSLPRLVGGSGGLVCESVGKADLLSDHFDVKQSRKSVDLSLTAIRLLDLPPVLHHLLDFDPYGGTDPLGMFLIFVKRTYVMAPPRLGIVFRWLVRLGSF